VSTYAALAGLAVEVEGYELEPLVQEVSSAFERRTTLVLLRGAGETGMGEDVTWDGEEQLSFQQRPRDLPLEGRRTLAELSELLDRVDLFPGGEPRAPEWRLYRRWALESAALDLALRQAGLPLAAVLGREAQPVTFVVSLRLGDPPSAARVRRLRDLYPGTRFKLDPELSWDDELIEELRATGAVDTLDFKSAYAGSWGQQPPDAGLYQRLAEAFPSTWLEDPNVRDPATLAVLQPHLERVTWDAGIHSVADVDALPFPPRMLNSKPSRFGSLRALADFYDACAERGIGLYGGGQFELGAGRGQIQLLAALFHPHAPNDVAPGGYNTPRPGIDLETSPLRPSAPEPGFRRLSQRGVSERFT
jgi:L-alanine-DL-glutamate epimerase-like enolase superfamily enzyme